MRGGQWAHGIWHTHGDSELACTWSSHRGRLLHLASQQVHAAGVTSPSRPQSAHPALWTPIPTAHAYTDSVVATMGARKPALPAPREGYIPWLSGQLGHEGDKDAGVHPRGRATAIR